MKTPTMEPRGFFGRIPLKPHELLERHTPTEDAIVLCHLGVPRIAAASWSLRIDGLVRRPMNLGFRDLMTFPKSEVMTAHECAGSPLRPNEPTRRVNNLVWGGVRLEKILDEAEPEDGARFLWSCGADHGEFDGVRVDAYIKDLPVERVKEDVLLAFELNYRPLPPEHGFPVRLLVPGYYGTNSVKWLTRITLADRRASGPFTTRWYNDPILDGSGSPTGRTAPVWSIAPESVIVNPPPGATLRNGEDLEIWGWAWADDEVSEVTVSTDDGARWSSTTLEPRPGRSWQRFALSWCPTRPGEHVLASRATASNGIFQPEHGRRNAIHRVTVTVA